MLEFLIDNISVSFGGTLFQQVVGIPMGTNCAPLLADLFLYSYESEFLQKLVKDKKIDEARAFNFIYRYIDDVIYVQKCCGRSCIWVSLTSSSGGYINGRNSANLELLIDKTSSIYLYMKLKALASSIFLSFTSF
jgi:hypothetical protein